MRIFLMIALALVLPMESHAQKDSVTVLFVGNNRGEHFIVTNANKKVIDFKTSGPFKFSFKIFRDSTWVSDQTPLYFIRVFRKNLFKFRYIGRTIVYYDKKYLVINRNHDLKRKLSIEYFWTDTEPLDYRDIPDVIR
ncbi:MAG TPA: hypothetical protein VL443_01765 [Cyclobacteriaceae bacterium]|jgi:hypothetical protein|nr:hypothetical protein [Cyclobacteriaceae bacterium]